MSGNEFQTVGLGPAIAKAGRPMAIRVESTARYEKLLSVRGTETEPGSDVRGWNEMVGDVPRSLTMHTPIHHDGHLVHNPFGED